MFRLCGYLIECYFEKYKDDPEFQERLKKLHQEQEEKLSRIQAENDLNFYKQLTRKWWQFWKAYN